MAKVDNISSVQSMIITGKVNSADLVEIGFLLNDVVFSNQPCDFPRIGRNIAGVENAVSSRLVWKNRIGVYTKTTTVAEKSKTVYNINRIECSNKNLFDLYLTLTDSDSISTEIFVVQGICYIYL